jgi:hypothetical protein
MVDAAVAPTALELELRSLAQRWNDALANHNVAMLSSVYGARVRLYGRDVDRKVAIKMKTAAASGDYTQSMGPIEIDLREPTYPRVLFTKTWLTKGKEFSIRASLDFAKENGRWVVIEESDAKADDAALQDNGKDSCLGLVHAAVMSTQDGLLYRHPPYGTQYVCGPPECDTYQIDGIRLGNEGMERMARFDVDPMTGVVSHVTPIVADPVIVTRMKAACAN